jgi:hypothetical protein
MFGGGFSGGPGWGGRGWGGPGWGGPGSGGPGWGGPGSGGPGWGGPGFGGPGWGGAGFAGPGWGGKQGWGGHGKHGRGRHGFAARRRRMVIGTAALLLEGPANAEQIVQRVSEATGGAMAPPQEIVEFALAKLAFRGFVSVNDGVATLTERGTSVLAWKGVSSEGVRAMLAQTAKFADYIKIRWGLVELAGLGRTIMWRGTDAQKEKLVEARTKVLTAINEAKQSLHSALAES